MTLPAVLFFSASMLTVKPSPVFADVCIGSNGPYRFLVDTGAQTSRIDPKLASRLNLTPAYRVEVVTQNSTRIVPAVSLKTLRIGKTEMPPFEVIFDDPVEAKRLDSGVRGVLGINALGRVDFTLSPAIHRLDLDSGRPDGESLPLRRIEDLITIPARMGRETLTFILDSGANHVILFRMPEAMVETSPVQTTLSTIEGARNVVPTCWTADMFFTNSLRVGTLPAAIVKSRGAPADGLLPASVFKTVYVGQTRGEVVLVR